MNDSLTKVSSIEEPSSSISDPVEFNRNSSTNSYPFKKYTSFSELYNNHQQQQLQQHQQQQQQRQENSYNADSIELIYDQHRLSMNRHKSIENIRLSDLEQDSEVKSIKNVRVLEKVIENYRNNEETLRSRCSKLESHVFKLEQDMIKKEFKLNDYEQLAKRQEKIIVDLSKKLSDQEKQVRFA
jgi:hypothetical protein